MKTRLAAALFAFSLSFAGANSFAFPGGGGGGPFPGIEEYGRQVVIGIETPFASGSGVIIGKRGSTYYFLTAAHVGKGDPSREEFMAYTLQDKGNKIRILSFESPPEFKGKDLVIGSFKSSKELLVVPIFALGDQSTWSAYGSYNNRRLNQKEQIHGDALVSGISIPTKTITIPLFRSSPASIMDRAPGNADGYELIYLATSTVPGMSGGPVLASRACPKWEAKGTPWGELSGGYTGLIAVHGRSEEYGQTASRSGASLGVPLDIFKNFWVKNAGKYGIPYGESYRQHVRYQCLNHALY